MCRGAESVGSDRRLLYSTINLLVSFCDLGADRSSERLTCMVYAGAMPQLPVLLAPQLQMHMTCLACKRERERETTVVADKQVTLVRSKHTLVRSTVMSI